MLLQSMRDKTHGWATKVVVTVIAVTFALFGLESLTPDPNNPDVAKVSGESISQYQLMETIDQQRRMLIQQMGENFNPALLNDPVLQDAALESLIQRTMIAERLKADNMVISEAMLDHFIRTIPEFQENGQYSPERVMYYVQNMGGSVLRFRNLLREELASGQLRLGIGGSEFITSYELDQLNSLQNQTRDVAWTVLDSSKVRDELNITDADVQAFYDSNIALFMRPEQVSLDYIVLDKKDLSAAIDITDEEIEAAYNQQLIDLKAKAASEMNASMILLEPNSSRDQAASLAEAQKISNELKAGGDFAALAKRHSDDADSAARGGSLGVVEPGFFGEAFDNALAVLAPGAISEPVETDFGVVLIRRDQVGEVRIPSLEQMRTSLIRELRAKEVEPLFVEQSQLLADISFESSDLAQPAEAVGLTVQQTGLFSRDGGEGIAADKNIIAAAFSADVLDLGANSDLIELSPERVAVVRIHQHNKPEPMPLADVREQIGEQLRRQQASELLHVQADALVAGLDNGTSQADLAQKNNLVWVNKENLQRFSRDEVPAEILVGAFRQPRPEQGEYSNGIVELMNGDVAVLQVSNVVAGTTDMDPVQKRMLRSTLAERQGEQVYQEYLKMMRANADVEIFLKKDN